MNAGKPEWNGEPGSYLRRQIAELLRSNETLRDQVSDLNQKNAELARRLQAAAIASQTEREFRRAALNLMEDAVASRRAAHQENLERRRADEELRDADRRKDAFLATLAHELRNPLAPI